MQKFIQCQSLKLSGGGITAIDTTIVLQELKDPGGNLIVTADLGTATYATLEPGSSKEEIISFNTITQNANGTATLTGVVRNLDFTTPYTQISSTGFSHAGATPLVISNNPQLYDQLVSQSNAESITGIYTFSTSAFPRMSESTTAPYLDTHLATKKYVDDTAGGIPLLVNRTVVQGTAGETLTIGQLIYLKANDGRWWKTDASVTGTTDKILLGIAQGAGTAGVAIVTGILLFGLDSNQTGMTTGTVMYVSDTAGAISSSTGTIEKKIGQAYSTTELYFDPWSIDFPITSAINKLEAITASAVEINNLNGYTGSTALLNESATFFGATDITGAEAEKLTDGSETDLHSHEYATGTATRTNADGTGTVEVTVGFAVKRVRIQAACDNSTIIWARSDGNSEGTGGSCMYVYSPGATYTQAFISANKIILVRNSADTNKWEATISAISATSFTISYVLTGTTGNLNILWEAFS